MSKIRRRSEAARTQLVDNDKVVNRVPVKYFQPPRVRHELLTHQYL
jgi:hypothetical protein